MSAFITLGSFAQEKSLQCNIKRNGNEVGTIHVTKGISGTRTVLTMESEVNTRFIFNFRAKAKEETIYDNDIQKLADHHYKIKFPDGNYNEYFYANGICSKMEIHHNLYRATIELKP